MRSLRFAVLCFLLVPSARRAAADPAGSPAAWEVGKPVVFGVDQLEKPRFAPDQAAADVDARGYLVAPVVRLHPYGDLGGVTFKNPLPPGRYRAAFEIGVEPYPAPQSVDPDEPAPKAGPNKPYTQGDLFAGVDIASVPPQRFRSRITPTDLPATGFVTKSVDFYIAPNAGGPVAIKPGWEGGPDAYGFRLRSVTVTRLTGPLFVADLRMDRVLYRPGEKGIATVTVANGSANPAPLSVNLDETTLFDEERSLAHLPLTLGAGQTQTVSIPFVAGTQRFGREVTARLMSGKTAIDQASEVSSVSDNLWYVAMGAVNNGIASGTGHYQDSIIAPWVAGTRAMYANWMEMDFWAPDDWGDLTPSADEWISGQAARYENKARLKKLINACHDAGIRAITYGKGLAGGPAALELARRRPDWFLKSQLGTTANGVDVWDIDHWNEIPFHFDHWKEFKSDWYRITPDLRRLDTLDHGIEQLVASTREYGWDGVRFDGQFSVSDDPTSTRNMQRMKSRLLQAFPNYSFGYNIGSPENFQGTIPHELREAAAGGGQWMNEEIGEWRHNGDLQYNSWREYAEHEDASAETVRRLGGTYHFIYRIQNTPALQSEYKFVLGTAAGAHPDYGEESQAAGCPNWGRFLTRWSALVWHPDLRDIKAENAVTAIESPRPLWDWMNKELVLSPTHRLVIRHLFNPPTSDRIDDKAAVAPAPIEGVRVKLRVPEGERLLGLYLVHPDSLEAVKLEPAADGTVTLPALNCWAMVVADLAGHYQPLPPLPATTEAPRLKGAPADQNPPAGSLKLRIRAAADVFWSAHHGVALDPQATAGKAASIDAKLGAGVMAGYFDGLVPGLYKATARIKVLNPSPNTTISFHVYAEEGHGSSREELKATDFAGAYHEVSLPVSYYGNQYVRVFVGGRVNNPDEAILLDWTKLELQEPFTDDKLIAESKLPAQPAAQVGPANKVLLLQGLYHGLFGLKNVLGRAIPQSDITACYERDAPKTAADLAPYGTLALIDYPLPPLEMRRAIRDWVRDGGHLLVFGGEYTLAQANWGGTFLEDVLPATLSDPPDVARLPDHSYLGASQATPFAGRPAVYYAHTVHPRPDARVLWWAGATPILLRHNEGRGHVTLFAGTVLGEAQNGDTPFWAWNGWQDALVKALSTP